jgi:ribosomal protein S18 acetylase RimI-like enzyme
LDGLTITKLNHGNRKEAARVFRDAFEGDVTLRQCLKLNPEQEGPFWDMAMSSYLKQPSEKACIYGGWLGDELVSCAAVHQGDFTPGQSGVLDTIKTLRRLFGYERMARFIIYSLQSASVVRTDADTLRLELLGCFSPYRGRKIGEKMLRFLIDQAKADGYKRMQLEFEEGVPAQSLYEREGFRVVRDIKLMGCKSYIMHRELTNGHEPCCCQCTG